MLPVTKFAFFIHILIASLIEYGGDASLKMYATTNSLGFLALGIFCYSLLVLSLIYILKYSNVMQMNIQWDALSVILETLLAYFFLKETLNGTSQYIGFFLIVTGLICMNLGASSYN